MAAFARIGINFCYVRSNLLPFQFGANAISKFADNPGILPYSTV